MIGPILVEIRELFEIVSASVLGNPVRTLHELLIPQHIQKGIDAYDRAEEVRPLGHGSANEQAAVAAARDGQLRNVCVLVGGEVFRCRDEIVENSLFFFEHSCAVPFLAKFPAAAQIGFRKNSAMLDPNEG